MLSTAVGIVREEGPLKLWQGVTPAVYRHIGKYISLKKEPFYLTDHKTKMFSSFAQFILGVGWLPMSSSGSLS